MEWFDAILIPNLPLAPGREENSSKRLKCCHRMIFCFIFVNVSDIKKDPQPDGCKGILKFNLRKLNASVGRGF